MSDSESETVRVPRDNPLFSGDGPSAPKNPDRSADHAICPRNDLHAACPQGYIAWHEWASKMCKTHVQTRCPGCGKFEIWVPKRLLDKLHKRLSQTDGQSDLVR